MAKNILHQIDNMEYMKEVPDNHFDLAIVDPPYGIERFKENDGGNSKKIKSFGDKEKNWNNEKPDKLYFQELFRISNYQIIWGGNNFILPESEYFIIWDKLQSMPSFARCEYAWTNRKIPAKMFLKRSQDINRIHPTQKPIVLYKWLLTNYAKPGYKLFDSHSGSGSFRIAAYDMGFDLVSCELDADYCRDNEARFQRHIQQQELFPPEEIQEKIYQDKELFNE